MKNGTNNKQPTCLFTFLQKIFPQKFTCQFESLLNLSANIIENVAIPGGGVKFTEECSKIGNLNLDQYQQCDKPDNYKLSTILRQAYSFDQFKSKKLCEEISFSFRENIDEIKYISKAHKEIILTYLNIISLVSSIKKISCRSLPTSKSNRNEQELLLEESYQVTNEFYIKNLIAEGKKLIVSSRQIIPKVDQNLENRFLRQLKLVSNEYGTLDYKF